MFNQYKILLYSKEKWIMPRNDSKKIRLQSQLLDGTQGSPMEELEKVPKKLKGLQPP
jgi:hypothetical protein